jgi:hypothetical protein
MESGYIRIDEESLWSVISSALFTSLQQFFIVLYLPQTTTTYYSPSPFDLDYYVPYTSTLHNKDQSSTLKYYR